MPESRSAGGKFACGPSTSTFRPTALLDRGVGVVGRKPEQKPDMATARHLPQRSPGALPIVVLADPISCHNAVQLSSEAALRKARPMTSINTEREWVAAAVAGVGLVAATRRMARRLRQAYHQHWLDCGASSWPEASILSQSAWTQTLLRHYSQRGLIAPILSEAQSEALWFQVVSTSSVAAELIAPRATAHLAAQAWRLRQRWSLVAENAGGESETLAYAEWTAAFKQGLHRLGMLDAASASRELPGLIRRHGPPTGQAIQWVGVLQTDPALEALIAALQARGVQVAGLPERAGDALATASPGWARLGFPNPDAELCAALAWARAKLANDAHCSVALVVPDLGNRAAEVKRRAVEILAPRSLTGLAEATAPAFDLVHAEPITDWPIATTALTILRLWVEGRLGSADWTHLLGSPYLTPLQGEHPYAWVGLDAQLRAGNEPAPELRAVLAAANATLPAWAKALATLAKLERPRGRLPVAQWASHFAATWRALGWPGVGLDSANHQAQASLQNALEEFANLGAIGLELDATEALLDFRLLAEQQAFRPETPRCRLDILPPLELPGAHYDAVWVLGLNEGFKLAEQTLPAFVGVAEARIAGVPGADPKRAMQATTAWLRAAYASAPQGVVSVSQWVDGLEQHPHPLISDYPLAEPSPAPPGLAARVAAATDLQWLEDARAPQLTCPPARTGSALLEHQSACPFRAWALHRAGAEPLAEPSATATAAERGLWLHRAMQLLWSQIGDSQTLADSSPEQRTTWVHAAVQQALDREGRRHPLLRNPNFRALEMDRLMAIAEAWLGLESERSYPFTVSACEARASLNLGTLEFTLRLDRIDQLADGQRIVIDYKTGARPTASRWLPPRTESPQLALYALAEPAARGVAVALPLGEPPVFHGLGDSDIAAALPGLIDLTVGAKNIPAFGSFQALLAAWTLDLQALVEEFQTGEARVAPRRGSQTCRHCTLASLCRIHECPPGLAALDWPEDDEELGLADEDTP